MLNIDQPEVVSDKLGSAEGMEVKSEGNVSLTLYQWTPLSCDTSNRAKEPVSFFSW